jgi:hypothetical protein
MKRDITLLHTLLEKHAPLTISVRSIKTAIFFRIQGVMCCSLKENNRSRFVQRSSSNWVLSRYNYEFYIVVEIVRLGLSVSIRCLCGTFSKTTGFSHMPLRHIQQDYCFSHIPLRHIQQDYRIQSLATAARRARLQLQLRARCGTFSKTTGFSHMPLRRIQKDYRLQSVYAAAARTARLPASAMCRCGTYSKTVGVNQLCLLYI